MERISIFNYEAFYLDFLEGNLNEEDHALFLKFLEENPELKLMDEEMPLLQDDVSGLDDEYKHSLKQPLPIDKVSPLNIEFFLISQSEGLLSIEKEKEVNAFVQGNVGLEREKALIGSVYFDANETFVCSEKKGLKRKKAIVLWPYYTAAASVVLAFILWNFNGTASVIDGPTHFVKKESALPEVNEKIPSIVIDEQMQVAKNIVKSEPTTSKKQSDKKQSLPLVDLISPNEKLSPRKPHPILFSLEDQKIKPIHTVIFPPNEIPSENNMEDMASVSFSEMENPIKPVTNFMEDKINRKVDFRRKKKELGESSGFFLKIGKLEISRKRN